MIAHGRGKPLLRHRAERGFLIQRIAQHILLGQRGEAIDEFVVDVLVHIDALDPAAALPGIEISAVDNVLDRMREIDVGAHIGRILAAEFEPDAGEGAGRRLLDRAAGRDRTGEADLIDLARRDQLQSCRHATA